jgi:hypothetical protein
MIRLRSEGDTLSGIVGFPFGHVESERARGFHVLFLDIRIRALSAGGTPNSSSLRRARCSSRLVA